MSTYVYKYGLLPPTVSADRVAAQMRAAHVYQNALVEVERGRRSAVFSALSTHPDVEPLAAGLEAAREELAAARLVIKAKRKASRTRSETSADRDRVRQLSAAAKDLRARAKAARQALKDDVAVQARISEINAEALLRCKALRSECGCYWGTYLLVEQAMDASRKSGREPKFRRWRGDGRVGVQLQGGLSAGAVFTDDTRLRIDPVPPDAWDKRRSKKQRTVLHLRVGSDGRAPIWASWPMIMHRPLPEGARVMWAVVKRDRIANRDRWSVHLTLRVPDSRDKRAPWGAVAVDVGWRQLANGRGGLRVGYWVDDEGHSREIRLPQDLVDGFHQVDSLASIRGKRFNEARDALATWLKSNTSCAEWLRESTKTLAQWRSPARLAAVVLRWRDERFEGDGAAYDTLIAWLHKDRHLWQWQENLRGKVQRRRKDAYRVLAARLADAHRDLIVEAFDKRTMQRRPQPESEDVHVTAVQYQQRCAATSDLVLCLRQAFAKRRGRVLEIPAAYTTLRCHRCGGVQGLDWDPATEVERTCEHCGEHWDQDVNAARNLLAAWREWSSADEYTGTARVKDYGKVSAAAPRFAKRHRSPSEDRSQRDA